MTTRTVMSSVVIVSLTLMLTGSCAAQVEQSSDGTLRQQITSAGVRRFDSGEWGVVGLELVNDRDEPVEVVTGLYFDGDPLTQFSRRLWVPAGAKRRTWIPVHPPVDGVDDLRIHPFFYEYRDGAGTLLRESNELMFEPESLFPAQRPVTVILEDRDAVSEESRAERKELAVAMRLATGNTRNVTLLEADEVPAFQQGFDAVDYLVLTEDRIADSPAALSTIRTWLEGGGRMWIMLDQVELRTVELLLGEAVAITAVDRVSLTEFQLDNLVRNEPSGSPQQHDDPVEFVRVIAEDVDVIHEIEGWPASFSQDVGEGRVTFTTLSAHGWMRPRLPHEQVSELDRNSTFIARQGLDELATYSNLPLNPPPLTPEDFRELLSDEIGYRIPGRGTVVLILGLFWGTLVIVGVWSLRVARLERLALIGPLLAGVASVPLAVLGYQATHTIPPAAALAEVVLVGPGMTATHSTGSAAMFVPEPTAADIRSGDGRLLIPQRDRLEGTVRQMEWTDLNEWHWAQLTAPTGLYFAETEQHAMLSAPLRATATFGPDGVSGQLESGSYSGASDALIATSSQHALAVHVEADGRFSAGESDLREPGIYLTAALLTDEQRRRQSVYRQMLLPRLESRYPRRPMLLAWTRPSDTSVTFPEGMALSRTSLLAIPLEIRPPSPDTDVFIPSPFLSFETVATAEGTTTMAHNPRTGQWQKTSYPTSTMLRFSVPKPLLPLTPVRGTVFLRIRAPMRTVQLATGSGENLVELAPIENAMGSYELPIDNSNGLRLDDDGGLLVQLNVSDLQLQETDEADVQGVDRSWKMDFIRLELFGRTAERSEPERVD